MAPRNTEILVKLDLTLQNIYVHCFRMRERELQRRQQEASGLQQNFFACKCSYI